MKNLSVIKCVYSIINVIGGFYGYQSTTGQHSALQKPIVYFHWNGDDAEMRRGVGMFPLAIIRT